MQNFNIDQRLRDDCHLLGKLPFCHLLLQKNATIPWLILVPPVDQNELHELDNSTFRAVMDEVVLVGRFVEAHFDVDKINTAAIGNIVRQLHIHVMGRRQNDPCWPGVIWGNLQETTSYADKALEEIRSWAADELALA